MRALSCSDSVSIRRLMAITGSAHPGGKVHTLLQQGVPVWSAHRRHGGELWGAWCGALMLSECVNATQQSNTMACEDAYNKHDLTDLKLCLMCRISSSIGYRHLL